MKNLTPFSNVADTADSAALTRCLFYEKTLNPFIFFEIGIVEKCS